MPRYFLHLRDSTDEVLDPEEVEIPADAIAGVALLQARDCMAGDVKGGRLDLLPHRRPRREWEDCSIRCRLPTPWKSSHRADGRMSPFHADISRIEAAEG